MGKSLIVFKRTSNLMLQFIGQEMSIGDVLPSEQHLANVCQASRSAVRSAITYLHTRRVLAAMSERRVLRLPADDDYFAVEELRSGSDRVEQALMEKVLKRDMQPGAEFGESELARESGASTVSVREFLIGFARYGLIERKPRGGWRLCAFDDTFANELADMRQRFEFDAVECFCALPPDSPAHLDLARLIARHLELRPRMHSCYGEFPALDRDFHTFLIGLLKNRFAQGFYDVASFVFHYHYQWEKSGQRERTTHALDEHLAILLALSAHDEAKALVAMRTHLDSARRTLSDAIQGRIGPAAT